MSTQAPQEEQNDVIFSSVAPSSEELWLPPNQMFRHGKGRHIDYCVVESFDGVSP